MVVHGLALNGVHQSISVRVNNDPPDMSCPLAEDHPGGGITIVSWQIAKCVANEPVAISWERLEQGIDVIEPLRKDDTSNSP